MGRTDSGDVRDTNDTNAPAVEVKLVSELRPELAPVADPSSGASWFAGFRMMRAAVLVIFLDVFRTQSGQPYAMSRKDGRHLTPAPRTA